MGRVEPPSWATTRHVMPIIALMRRAPTIAGALVLSAGCYCFAAQVLVVASHTPPALSQSAFVLAVVTS